MNACLTNSRPYLFEPIGVQCASIMSDGRTNTIAVSSTAEEILSLISLAVSSDSTRQVLSVTTQWALADAAIAPSKVGYS